MPIKHVKVNSVLIVGMSLFKMAHNGLQLGEVAEIEV